MKLENKVAIITGAGRGIGRSYALRFAEEGAKVVIADIILENSQKVAQEIAGKGGTALAIHTDIADEASAGQMAGRTVERFGKIDILLNNAAVFYGVESKAWNTWTVAEWQKMFAVNVTGSWLCARAAVPHMVKQNKGKIINIASGTADFGLHTLLPYACSKGAVMTLTRCLARALGRHNINVNCISPGFTIDEATLLSLGGREEAGAGFNERRCLRRFQRPEDLVGTAVFLASADSDFLTGQVISVDGGDVLR
ncbi:MAG: glucose 1-dehydrogenase [Chloroflexi bacterium]|nr:glucose 1-dehydrogenase [Chloroflexota bacterium]